MTCTSSSSRRPTKPLFAARPVAAAASLLTAWLAAMALWPAPAGAVPYTRAFRSDDASLLGVVDSVQSSVLTVVAYPPADGSSRSGKKRRLIGTALAISGNRFIASASVAIPGGRVRVLLGGGVERPATLRGVDRQSNIALFEVEGATLRPLRPASPRSLAIGSWVAVVSNVAITRPQASLGRILGRGERLDFAQNGGEVLEIDAPSYPGSTGGAVLNEEGEWVAVVVGRAAVESADGSRVGMEPESAGAPDLNGVLIALPVEHAGWIANELEHYGSVRHGFLGIQLRRASATAESLGVLVAAVVPGSPADSAGFRPGDRILAVEGEETHSADELTAMVRAARPGDEIEVTVLRKNEIFPIRAVVGVATSGLPIGPRLAPEMLRQKKDELERLELEKRRLQEEIQRLEETPGR
ncbi:MAG TPA: trypsin-like peptidase domain-containing protein [Acidobacteriota bacterium]|nr:trypsin-like peptidase domain-containing protein [Acidobacteriota bacterium]